MKTAICWFLLATVVACGAAKRPAGLPAPEYEDPRVEPWNPPQAAPTATEAPAIEPAGGEPAPEEPVGPSGNNGGSGATLSPGTQ